MSVKSITRKQPAITLSTPQNASANDQSKVSPEAVKNFSKTGFVYSGTDVNGRKISKARVPFQRLDEAQLKLKIAGIKVEKIAPLPEFMAIFNYKKKSKPSVMDMANLADQIAAQYSTGLSFDKISRILGRVHPKEQLRKKLNSVADMIQDGTPAYQAFGAQTDNKGKPFFPRTFVYAFQIGEKIGALPDPETGISGDAPVIMLRFFAKAQRKSAELSKSIVKGLISPAAILISCIVVFFIQVYFIVPQFAQIFVGLLSGGGDTSLPFATQIMMDISDFFYSAPGAIFAIAFFGLLFGSFYYFGMNDKGIDLRGRLILKLPILKGVFLPYHASIFCRNLSIMYADPNVSSRYETIAETTVNPIFRELAKHCREQLLMVAPPFNELFNGHLHLLGESFAPVAETVEANPGRAQQLIYTYARFLEEEAEEKLAIAITTLNKAVYFLSAGLVAFILIASYSPLIELVGRLARK